jgi:uncharacterized membrane protein
MAFSGWFDNLNLLFRWLHVIAGITWIGLLYFFNFVNVPLQGALDDAGKKAVNPKLMPRALWWFRWAAMVTFIVGLLLFVMIYMYKRGVGLGPSDVFLEPGGKIADRAWWIMFGMTFATIMWFNVWFIIWPAQKKMLGGKASPEELPVIRRRAFLASRTNTYLSGPMLFGMLAANHYSAINWLTWVVALAIGFAAIWWAIKSSSSVGTSV